MPDSLERVVIALTPHQQADLFQQAGLLVRRLAFDQTTGETHLIDRCCKRCLLADDLPDVHINEDGLCHYCVEFEANQKHGEYDPRKVAALINTYRGHQTPDCVVAFSGGKDSAAALLVAIETYGLKPVAVLVDNGFIPKELIDHSRAWCRRLGVDLVVRTISLHTSGQFGDPKSGAIPCRSCITQVFKQMADMCQHYGVRLVIGGHRFPPLAYTVGAFTHQPVHEQFLCVSPLLALRMTEAEQVKFITSRGWTPVDVCGNTSNCKLIGYIEEQHFDRFNYNPHIYEVSKEIRAGFYSRSDGMRKVERPSLTEEHRRDVERRISAR